jgi:hypothetical protein
VGLGLLSGGRSAPGLKQKSGKGGGLLLLCESMSFSSETATPIDSVSAAVLELKVNCGSGSEFDILDACRLCVRLGEEGGLEAMKAGGGCRAGERDTDAIFACVPSFAWVNKH